MSIRESAQPITHSGGLPYKAVSLMEELVGPAVNTVLSVSKQPELIISPSVLTFVQRTSDKPVFSILTLAQQHANTPITLSTDEPDYFQLASDSRPAFGPTLTFTPPPSGAYVHVRYMAPKGCFHHAQLTIEAPYTSATVALEARTTGALSFMRDVLPATNRVPVKQPDRVSLGSRRAALLATVIVSGLLYAGYTYQCQLFPNLCQERTATSARLKNYSPLPEPTPDHFATGTEKRERSHKEKLKAKEAPDTRTSSERTSVAFTDGSTGKSSENQSDEQQSAVRSRTSIAITDKENTATNLRPRVRRQQDSTPSAKESELERELNRQF